MNLPESKLTKNQKKVFEKIKGKEKIVVTIRHDDNCRNGHNTFSITGNLYERQGEYVDPARMPYVHVCGGQIQEDIARLLPELEKYFKWHLVSTNGPMHYIANTIYHAGDRDYNGLKKDELRQIKNGNTGLPSWKLTYVDRDGNEINRFAIKEYPDSETQPDCPYHLEYRPWLRIGEGKEPDLEAARSCSVWPEATLEQLQDKEALLARLPALMEGFKKAVESLGFVY